MDLILGVRDADRFLYHYTKAPTAVEHILADRKLRFGRYTETNDPKESKNWQFDIGTAGERDLSPYDRTEMSHWLSHELKARTRLACFSMDRRPLTGDHLVDLYNRGFARARMWAQYTERHSGMCLVFERARLQELIQAQFGEKCIVASGPVGYVDRSIVRRFEEQEYLINIDYLESVGRDAYPKAHIQTHNRRLFFEKLMDWRDEDEFRWVLFSSSEDDLFLDFKDALVGIMFGERTSEADIERSIAQTKEWGLSYAGLKWKNCSPWYDLGNWRFLPDGGYWKEHLRRVQGGKEGSE